MKTDTQLQQDVLAELEWEPSINAFWIGVTAKGGVVTLTSSVASYAAKMMAKRVYGVKAVANDVEVKVPGSSERSDADIAAAALSALKWDATVPECRIKVTVRNGWITLEGHVDWGYQKDAALRAVRNLTGVTGLSSQITVRSHVRPGDVKDKIEAAFKGSAELDARRMSMEAHDGKVILKGNVHSWTEKDEAEQAAWAAPGVSAVENLLTVTP